MFNALLYHYFRFLSFLYSSFLFVRLAAVIWLKYCRYGVKHYPINQMMCWLLFEVLFYQCIRFFSQAGKLTVGQKRLSKVDKSGMKSLASFFSPKAKS